MFLSFSFFYKNNLKVHLKRLMVKPQMNMTLQLWEVKYKKRHTFQLQYCKSEGKYKDREISITFKLQALDLLSILRWFWRLHLFA